MICLAGSCMCVCVCVAANYLALLLCTWFVVAAYRCARIQFQTVKMVSASRLLKVAPLFLFLGQDYSYLANFYYFRPYKNQMPNIRLSLNK